MRLYHRKRQYGHRLTEAPETLKQFFKQRFRWSYGVMQTFWKNRDALLNWKYRWLGMLRCRTS
jgi:cellulose synthase/poly-beta-1,6-N-acetylglucosamine synthase-like glycosyltransferase